MRLDLVLIKVCATKLIVWQQFGTPVLTFAVKLKNFLHRLWSILSYFGF